MLVLAAAAFAVGLWHLFRLRFEAGDVYPPYSSLRADPVGSMAFYESLARLPGVTVSRDFSEGNRLPQPVGTTYLHLAARSYDWEQLPEALFREIEAFVLRGGRLVVAFHPEAVVPAGFLSPEGLPNLPPPRALRRERNARRPPCRKAPRNGSP